MDQKQHPGGKEIEEYVRDILSDEKHLAISEHLFSCPLCMSAAREEFTNNLIVENWSSWSSSELLWREQILLQLKDPAFFEKTIAAAETPTRLAAESPAEHPESLIKHYYSNDKKIIATVEYMATETEITFQTREAGLTDLSLSFALANRETREIVVCGKVKLEARARGIREKKWLGQVDFSPELTLIFDTLE